MTRKTVDLRALNDTTDSIDTFVDDLRRLVVRVQEEVADKATGVWSGEAESAYQERHRDWKQLMATVEKDFSDLHRAARTAHSNYSSAKSTNREMLGRGR